MVYWFHGVMNRVAKLHYLQRTPAPLEIFSTHTSVIGLRRAWKTAQRTATVRTIEPFFVSNEKRRNRSVLPGPADRVDLFSFPLGYTSIAR